MERTDSRAITGIKRKRTFRVCVPCRQSKIKCSGERPVCARCRQRTVTCVYDAEAAEPAWVQTIAPSTSQLATQETTASNVAPSTPQTSLTSTSAVPRMANCPPALSWLTAPELPPKPKLHSLLEAYFYNVHPVRVFAFIHKPSFMRMLEEGLLTETSDQALLHIMCSLGARFVALDYSESTARLPRELIQNAGSQWAKIAEEMFFADYSTISVTKLKVLVLLHDHEARTGNYAGSFLLTGLIIRMAQALQIHQEYSTDILCKEVSNVSNEVSIRENRRRLMWACYMVDVWAGSGVDSLTILNEKDIRLQLPCNERQFLLQIPCVTERLEPGEVLDYLPAEDLPEKPRENMGMSAYYVRIVHIWQRVLRLIKHPDEVQPPWLPGAEFANLLDVIRAWKQSLPSWLDFSSDNIYIRRESSQLGALFLIHCMYHHVLCDLHSISLPDLFKAREPFVFPPEQFIFKARLQTITFENAQRTSVLISTTLQHGVKYLADPILPSFVYNSSRIMLYYIARVLDRSKPDAGTVINRTIELVQHNNQALRDMSQMYPLAEPLYVTTERWLGKVRESIKGGHAVSYIAPADPSGANEDDASDTSRPSPSSTVEPAPDTQLTPLPALGPTSRDTEDSLPMSTSPSTFGAYLAPTGYPYTTAPASQSLPVDIQTSLIAMSNAPSTQVEHAAGGYYHSIGNIEQPMFDLNDLQNFFEWENGEHAPSTGFEGFGPLGWNGLSSVQ